MYFLPISLAIFIVFLLLVPFLIFLLPAVAFSKLGLSPFAGLIFFLLCLLGSSMNIPVYRKELDHHEAPDETAVLLNRFFGIRVPETRERIITVNIGGAVLPGLLCLYLLPRVDLGSVTIATIVTTVFSYYLSKPVKGIGVVVPALIPPVIAAVAALIFSERADAPAVAYISGVMGIIIGADLLRIHQIRRTGLAFLSIGGAGVFDGIFVVGIVSVLLA